jgi:hypothetical protein
MSTRRGSVDAVFSEPRSGHPAGSLIIQLKL